jgi:hypothetical protein
MCPLSDSLCRYEIVTWLRRLESRNPSFWF